MFAPANTCTLPYVPHPRYSLQLHGKVSVPAGANAVPRVVIARRPEADVAIRIFCSFDPECSACRGTDCHGLLRKPRNDRIDGARSANLIVAAGLRPQARFGAQPPLAAALRAEMTPP